jgi:hypothetical protein
MMTAVNLKSQQKNKTNGRCPSMYVYDDDGQTKTKEECPQLVCDFGKKMRFSLFLFLWFLFVS